MEILSKSNRGKVYPPVVLADRQMTDGGISSIRVTACVTGIASLSTCHRFVPGTFFGETRGTILDSGDLTLG